MGEKLYLPHSGGCFICGKSNPHGLQITFYSQGDKVHVDFTLQDHFNSYKDVAHGGVLSALLDESMGWAAFIHSDSEQFFFTRELTVTYKKNAPLGVPLLVTTEFVGMEKGILASAKGKITDENGTVYATSKGLFFPVPAEKMSETKAHMIFEDDLDYHPKSIKYCK